MPFGGVKLVPGVNVERTPTLNEAGVVQSQLIRYRDGLAAEVRRLDQFLSVRGGGVPRDLHAWDDLNQVSRLAVGTTSAARRHHRGDAAGSDAADLKTDFAPNFSTTVGSIRLAGGGGRPISPTCPPTIRCSSTPRLRLVASSCRDSIRSRHHRRAQLQDHGRNQRRHRSSTMAARCPTFTTVTGSSNVSVTLTAHGLTSAPENTIVFPIPTAGNGITIDGLYTAASITSANALHHPGQRPGHAAGTVAMNAATPRSSTTSRWGRRRGRRLRPRRLWPRRLRHRRGPDGADRAPRSRPPTGPDNWGQLLLACPEDGGIYYWDPTGGFRTPA
jgi:hypothetical protein